MQRRIFLQGESGLIEEELAKREHRRQRHNLANRAFNEGIINQQELDQVNQRIDKKETFAPGGAAAAVLSGSREAYSAIVRAVNKTAADDFAKKQYDEVKLLAPLLEKIEQKETIRLVTKS